MAATNGANGTPHHKPSLPPVYIVAVARTPIGSFLGYELLDERYVLAEVVL